MIDIPFVARGKIIHADNFAGFDQLVAQMRTDKTGAADNQNVLFFKNSMLSHKSRNA